MATEETDIEFEDIDWEELQKQTTYSKRNIGLFVALAAQAFLFVWDRLMNPDTAAVDMDGVPLLGEVFWDISAVDYLYMLTLTLGLFYIVIPLYQNKRMTMFYWRQFRKNKAAVISLIFLGIVFSLGTFGPIFLEPPTMDVTRFNQPPIGFEIETYVTNGYCVGETTSVPGAGYEMCQGSWEHPLGTTNEGKDILISAIYGMQISMQIGLIATLIVIVLATLVGTASAYFGGLVDEVLMRWVDIQLTFPVFFLYLLLVYLWGGSIFLMIIIFGGLGWGGVSRIVRSEALQRREEEYVKAAKAAGASSGWIMRRHLVPNVSNSVITAATLLIPSFILTEAALAFLELGDPTIPSWGKVIADGRGYLHTAWWISTMPGFFLFFTVLAFNFMGDALRDALDPRMEGGEH